MMRVIKSLAIFVLTTGLVYPYIHLSLHAHRYCPYHHAFEPINPDEENGPTHNPGPGAPHHKKCPFAQMMGAVAVTGPAVTGPVAVQAWLQQPVLLSKTIQWNKSNVLSLAPKQSPPSVFS